MDEFQERFIQYVKDFNQASSLEIQNDIIRDLNTMREEFGCMKAIAFIRHSQNVKDDFYCKEYEYMSKASVKVQELVTTYYKALLQSCYKEKLKEKWGDQLFRLAEQTINTYAPEVAKELEEEGRLSNMYMSIIGQAKIMFQGQERNLMQLYPFMESKERTIRKKAHGAYAQILKDNQERLHELYDSLVKIRHKIARGLGYENYLGLGYARLGRTDYTKEMVADFRDQVYGHVTPLLVTIRERQRERLGLRSLKYYDEDIKFIEGNAVPKGGPDHIIESSRRMYGEMSKETGDFFSYMIQKGLMDILDRDNKAKMGYCATIPKHKDVFVFSTFNGTSYDVSVMTHELGHAFQVYCSSDQEVPEYIDATAEISELHAMAMEFFAWPWLHLFFEGDADRFKYSNLADAITLNLLIGVIGDEFQEWVYQNPEATPEQRNSIWRQIEKKYWPYKDYDGNTFYEEGGFWLRFLHFFQAPLYLIDYSLALICAFQFFKKDQEGNKEVWNDYVRLCKAGGSASFLELLELANLKSPFEDNCVASVIAPIARLFEKLEGNL